ncbi:hypothetical protein ACO0K8_02185 [Undibacterium sp. Ren11W]
MYTVARFCALASLLWTLLIPCAVAQDSSSLPKYGSGSKSDAQRTADERFLAGIDQQYKGDRKKAGQEFATRGWQSLRQGNPREAMRRFNQAWLLDSSNGHALWGMGAVQGDTGKSDEAIKLFQEAEKSLRDDIDFATDYARTLGMAAAEAKDDAALQQAFKRYARIQERAPNHTLNLQNWAITLFYVGNYAEAWRKLSLAEATPRRGEIDAGFVEELQKKMPRP